MATVKRKVPEYQFDKHTGLTPRREMIRFAAFVAKRLGFKVTASNLSTSELGDDIGIGTDSPDLTIIGGLIVVRYSSTSVTVSASTVGGTVPLIGGTRLDAIVAPTLAVSGSEITYIYLQIQAVLQYTNGFVSGFLLPQGNVAIIASSDSDISESNNPLTGLFHYPLATVHPGGSILQFRTGPVEVIIADDGSGTGQSQILLD